MVAQPEQNAEEIRQMPVCTSDSALPSPYLFSEGKDLPTPSDEENPPTPAEFISEKKADPLIVTWEDYDMHENPRKWKTSHRLLMVIIVSLYSLQSPMTSSMTAPALDVLMEDFHVSSSTLGNMMMSIQVLAFAVGPIVFAPLSEKFGRKNVIQLMNLIFLIFNMGCGFSKTTTHMMVLRFFAGLAGAAPISMSAGCVADLFEPEERGKAMSTYTLMPVLGPCIGPMFAAWIIQAWGPSKWPWIFWFSSIFGAVIAVVGFITLSETYTPVLLERKAQRLRQETGNLALRTAFTKDEPFMTRFVHGLFRPAVYLVTEIVVFVPALYQAILFGCQYLLLAIFPVVFRDQYHMNVGIASLHYIPFLIGFMLYGQGGGRLVDVLYRRLKAKNGGQGKPEYKVPLLLATGIFMPIGLLLFGWGVHFHTHWIVPDIGIVFLAMGIRSALFICPLYLAESVPVYSASAVSAGVSLRCLFAFVFPLFSPPMYDALGQGGGNTLLAGVSGVVGIFTPIFLFFYGEKLRLRSKESKHAMALMT
ncbi:hypothetical protein MEQU1_003478 [Malassezia equina]|uniref:Major facilitator superfamily (MFS) profile domain-containing protein n=1 Tax=Malassezia equina TaxID=1381935 RepID=A0AAF0J1S2_9BASI|nr:hypothetical protein MEQU1_003478 [Malassezia equina]